MYVCFIYLLYFNNKATSTINHILGKQIQPALYKNTETQKL